MWGREGWNLTRGIMFCRTLRCVIGSECPRGNVSCRRREGWGGVRYLCDRTLIEDEDTEEGWGGDEVSEDTNEANEGDWCNIILH